MREGDGMTVARLVALLLVAVVGVSVVLRRRELERAPAVLRLLAVLFAVVVAAGSRFGVVVTWLAAAFLLLIGLGFGLLLLPAALAEAAAAGTQRRPRLT
jgi:hypothetical protein